MPERGFPDSGSGISFKSVFIITILLSLGWFFFQGNVGFSLQDEGYLWSNAQQTRLGAVPIRDFRSYDPGRYYWTAVWFLLLGNSFFALRLSLTVVQAIGLLFGLLLIRRIIRQRWLLVLIGCVWLLWMFPSYKSFEHTLVLGALFFAIRLLERPDRIRYFASGIFVGTAAFFGKNLGVYFFLGFFSLILFLGWEESKKELIGNCMVFFAGLIIGYLPLIFMLLFVPGFFASFTDSILRLFGPYAPVKYLPIPWPWKVPLVSLPLLNKIRLLSRGIVFVSLFVFYISGVIAIFLSKKPLSRSMTFLVASVFVGIPLLYHVCGRADFDHLAQGIHPMLVGLVAVAVSAQFDGRKKLAAMTVLFIGLISFPLLFRAETMVPMHRLKGAVLGNSTHIRYEIVHSNFWLPRTQVDYLNTLTQFLSRNMRPEENILIAPYSPGLYCLLGKQSPIWDAYPIHKAPIDEQTQSIRDMESKNVRWALIDTFSMDKIKERSFPFTHELIWRYILREFEPVDCPGLPKSQILFRRPMGMK